MKNHMHWFAIYLGLASGLLGGCSQGESSPAANAAPAGGKSDAMPAMAGSLRLQPESLRERELQPGVGAVVTVAWGCIGGQVAHRQDLGAGTW